MKYNNVNVDTKVEWIISRLNDADGWVYRSTLEDEMLSYDKFTESKFRTAIKKIETLNFAEVDTEPEKGGINDKKMYKCNQSVVESYLNAKSEEGLERRLSTPSASDTKVGEIREELKGEVSQRQQLESDVRQLSSTLDDLKRLFNGRSERNTDAIDDLQDRVVNIEEQLAEIDENMDYLMEHAKKEKVMWCVLDEILGEDGIDIFSKVEQYIEDENIYF